MTQRPQRADAEGTEARRLLNRLTDCVIGAAIEVHREVGPGLLESAYQRSLANELRLRGVRFEEQKICPIRYKDLVVDDAYRLDFLIEGKLVVEIKAVDALLDVHEAQVLTCLRYSACDVGLLMNFRSKTLARHGLRRLAL